MLSVRDGKTGQEIWNVTSPRNVFVVPLGGKQSVGYDSFYLFDWFNWEFPHFTSFDYAHVSPTTLRAYDGRDGIILWTGVTFNAPIDLFMMLWHPFVDYSANQQWSYRMVNEALVTAVRAQIFIRVREATAHSGAGNPSQPTIPTWQLIGSKIPPLGKAEPPGILQPGVLRVEFEVKPAAPLAFKAGDVVTFELLSRTSSLSSHPTLETLAHAKDYDSRVQLVGAKEPLP